MSRNMRVLLLASATAALLAGAASAASAMTMTIGDPSLTAKVLVSVPITASCSAFDPSLTPVSSSASVSIEQATGKAIARGSASLFTFAPTPLLFPCDGANHTVGMDVLADAAGGPFRRGQAVMRASAFSGAAQSCGPNCFFGGSSQSATVGPTAVKIR